MNDMHLPADLAEFLAAGRELDYDPAGCEAGRVALVRLADLTARRYPADAAHSGSHLVLGVDLIRACDGYDPDGLLLWLPVERRYATWDGEHGSLRAFGPEVTWGQIAAAPAAHLNAQWEGIDPASPPVADLSPWPGHPHSPEQFSHPRPA